MPCNDVLADTPGGGRLLPMAAVSPLMDKNGASEFSPLPEAWARRNLSTNLIADV
ncbi:MAG: hypothetical protein H6569_10525 [Lewinellaceae bacterium]|nr:hypothetical protein [Lewinellaceae bacterium]